MFIIEKKVGEMDLKSLNSKQLENVISEANSALNRRRKVEKALLEMQRITKKYKLNKDELTTALTALQPAKSALVRKPVAVRAKVAPKYQSKDGAKIWTGRGRTPLWVVELCQTEGLTVRAFKSDPRFLI